MDLVKQAGRLKPKLVQFALSGRFDDELSALIERNFPSGIIADDPLLSMTIDHFILQHRLASGATVVEEFVTAQPGLSSAERDMLLGWRDVVEGIFDVTGKDGDAVVLVNLLDELTYRARSNLGRQAFATLKKQMIVICRLVRAGEDWLVSGDLATYPIAARGEMLAAAAEQATRYPDAVFRNPAKLAEARHMLAKQHQAFTDLYGADLIVVPAAEVPGKIEEFHGHLAQLAGADAESPKPVTMGLPEELLAADTAAIHFVKDEGLSFYPDYRLLEELFGDPALVSRRRYRETLSGFLADPDNSPEPLLRLAARDPAKASQVFTQLLRRKRGFSWETDGEDLLRKHKPTYYDGTRLPRTVVLGPLLAGALRASR